MPHFSGFSAALQVPSAASEVVKLPSIASARTVDESRSQDTQGKQTLKSYLLQPRPLTTGCTREPQLFPTSYLGVQPLVRLCLIIQHYLSEQPKLSYQRLQTIASEDLFTNWSSTAARPLFDLLERASTGKSQDRLQGGRSDTSILPSSSLAAQDSEDRHLHEVMAQIGLNPIALCQRPSPNNASGAFDSVKQLEEPQKQQASSIHEPDHDLSSNSHWDSKSFMANHGNVRDRRRGNWANQLAKSSRPTNSRLSSRWSHQPSINILTTDLNLGRRSSSITAPPPSSQSLLGYRPHRSPSTNSFSSNPSSPPTPCGPAQRRHRHRRRRNDNDNNDEKTAPSPHPSRSSHSKQSSSSSSAHLVRTPEYLPSPFSSPSSASLPRFYVNHYPPNSYPPNARHHDHPHPRHQRPSQSRPALPPHLTTSLTNDLFLLTTQLRTLRTLQPHLHSEQEQQTHARLLTSLTQHRSQLLHQSQELEVLWREMRDLEEEVGERVRRETAGREWQWRVRASRRALGLPLAIEGDEVLSLGSDE